MSLRDMLVRLKLVELDGEGASAGAGAAGAGEPPELAELLRRVPPAAPVDERKLAAAVRPAPVPAGSARAAVAPPPSGGEIPDFAAIYRSAGVADPAHGFTAFKVLEILASPELAQLDGKAKAAALATFLRMNPAGAVPIADVLEDAVRRDQALDEFEKFLRAKLAQRGDQARDAVARLQAEIDAVTARNRAAIEAEERAVDAARTQLESWCAAKRVEEQRLAAAVAPFVERNPITTTEA